MITGAVNQAGPKEDRLEQKMPTQPLNGFDQVFKIAEDPTNRNLFPKRPFAEIAADPRLRAEFKRERAENRPPSRENFAEIEHRDPVARAEAPARLIQKKAKAEASSLTDGAKKPDAPSKALERREGDESEERATAPASMMAQAGLAAYKLAPHGNGEAQFAELAGAIPLGESLTEEETLGAEAGKLENKALFAKPPAKPDLQIAVNIDKNAALQVGENRPLGAVDILNLSREPAELSLQQQEASLLEAKLDSAQARNELMMRLQQGAATQAAIVDSALPATNLAARSSDINRGGSDIFKNAENENPVQSILPTSGGATATSTLGEKPSAIRADQIIERIAQQAKWIIGNNRNEATFKLQPEHLGEITLKVIQTEGQVRLDMTVDNHAVKQLVEARMDELQALLQDQQLAGDQFEFNVDVRQGDGSRQSQGFELQTSAADLDAAGKDADSAQPSGAQGNGRPIWGQSGSGIYI